MLLAASGAGHQPEARVVLRPLRVGVVNIMPHAETYESYIARPLERAVHPVRLSWIRLRSHLYKSSDARHLEHRYVSYERATTRGPLDGLVLTGAPVEEMEFESVRYWSELSGILRDCARRGTRVLGICWGGLALAKLVGLEKRRFDRKLFGVFEEKVLAPDHPIVGGSDDVFRCAHSRHSGIRPVDLEQARDAGKIRLLSYGEETGYSLFESADRAFLMHLGHPEYEAARLAHEWQRDSALGRADVDPPRHFDLDRPTNVWRSHCNHLFSSWLADIARPERASDQAPGVSVRRE